MRLRRFCIFDGPGAPLQCTEGHTVSLVPSLQCNAPKVVHLRCKKEDAEHDEQRTDAPSVNVVSWNEMVRRECNIPQCPSVLETCGEDAKNNTPQCPSVLKTCGEDA